MIAAVAHWWDGYLLYRDQKRVRAFRVFIEKQRAELLAADAWAERELERIGDEVMLHKVRTRRRELSAAAA